MNIIWGMSIFFFVVFFAFTILAFFFPEWVGINGSKAREVQQTHEETNPPDNP